MAAGPPTPRTGPDKPAGAELKGAAGMPRPGDTDRQSSELGVRLRSYYLKQPLIKRKANLVGGFNPFEKY